jgi:hypothetical protein
MEEGTSKRPRSTATTTTTSTHELNPLIRTNDLMRSVFDGFLTLKERDRREVVKAFEAIVKAEGSPDLLGVFYTLTNEKLKSDNRTMVIKVFVWVVRDSTLSALLPYAVSVIRHIIGGKMSEGFTLGRMYSLLFGRLLGILDGPDRSIARASTAYDIMKDLWIVCCDRGHCTCGCITDLLQSAAPTDGLK